MKTLKAVKLGYSPIDEHIYLYRHGADPALALERRVANEDVMRVLVQYMTSDAEQGSAQVISIGDRSWCVSVTPVL